MYLDWSKKYSEWSFEVLRLTLLASYDRKTEVRQTDMLVHKEGRAPITSTKKKGSEKKRIRCSKLMDSFENSLHIHYKLLVLIRHKIDPGCFFFYKFFLRPHFVRRTCKLCVHFYRIKQGQKDLKCGSCCECVCVWLGAR